VRVLITGITGMAGSFLAEYLVEHHPDVEVFGTFRWRSKLDNLQDLRNRGKLNVLDEGQRITDPASLHPRPRSRTTSYPRSTCSRRFGKRTSTR
jgi:nucleoside-diphosphate-sugar epimerase